jgi:hypothetical protein
MISSHVMELNVLSHIYPRFYMDLLKQAEDNPLSSQIRDNTHPPPLFINDEPQYTIEEVKRARLKKMGRGNRKKILVKWKEYRKKT